MTLWRGPAGTSRHDPGNALARTVLLLDVLLHRCSAVRCRSRLQITRTTSHVGPVVVVRGSGSPAALSERTALTFSARRQAPRRPGKAGPASSLFAPVQESRALPIIARFVISNQHLLLRLVCQQDPTTLEDSVTAPRKRHAPVPAEADSSPDRPTTTAAEHVPRSIATPPPQPLHLSREAWVCLRRIVARALSREQ